jgi:ribulose-phosphate 3-epimerase
MVTDPAKWISDFANAGANMYTFHVETLLSSTSSNLPSDPAVPNLLAQLISKVKSNKMMVGVALKPSTPLDPWLTVLETHILSGDIDMVLIMTVEPGFGGQSFMSSVLPKVSALRSKFPGLNIEVDGGLNLETVKEAAAAGANVIVAGSSVFGSKDPGAVIKGLRESVVQASIHW